MFERFTSRARRAIVLAQEEARELRHNYIGTEHILLGLLHEGHGLAVRALERFEMPVVNVRLEVQERVGLGKAPVGSGHIPFTPRAKNVLELALREALGLQHNYIGTEHILLGLVAEREGVGAQILKAHAGDLLTVRMAVLDVLPPVQPIQGRWLRRGFAPAAGEKAEPVNVRFPPQDEELRTTPAADASLSEARRLAGSAPVGSHHLLLAALADPEAAAARALAGLGLDLDRAREALGRADVTGTSDEPPEDAGRRTMVIRVTDEAVTVEASDAAITALGRAALDALGGETGASGTIRGDQPDGAGLSALWKALAASLEDIRRRAAARGRPGRPDEPGEPQAGSAA